MFGESEEKGGSMLFPRWGNNQLTDVFILYPVSVIKTVSKHVQFEVRTYYYNISVHQRYFKKHRHEQRKYKSWTNPSNTCTAEQSVSIAVYL